MNYHNDEWIMAGLQRHYEEALKYIPKERIIGITLWGSQNIGLDHKYSDIDSACIFIPSLEDIQKYPNWVEQIKISIGHEILCLIDIRLLGYGLELRSLYHLERIYSPYKIIPNEQYIPLWEEWKNLANNLVNANKLAAAQSIDFYMWNQWVPNSTKDFIPQHKEAAMRIGYDHKKVAYMIRGYCLLQLLLTDYPYSYMLNPHLNQLAKDAKIQKYDTLSAHWLVRFLELDYKRLFAQIKTLPIDKEKNNELIVQIKEIERKIICDYHGESAAALYRSP